MLGWSYPIPPRIEVFPPYVSSPSAMAPIVFYKRTGAQLLLMQSWVGSVGARAPRPEPALSFEAPPAAVPMDAPEGRGLDVLVTLPVYNEEAMLYASVHRMVEGLRSSNLRYRLSIAEDGSVDRTREVIARLKAEFPDLIVRTNPLRQGRGYALRQLWSEIDADRYVFVDADLAAGPGAVVRVVDEIRRGAEVATGSRYCPGAVVQRPLLRHLVSRAYNRLVRLVFDDGIRDHQCGLKAFSREAKSKLMAMTREGSWAWDTEVLVLARLSGMRVVEVPVEWKEYRSPRTPLRRLLSDIYLHGLSLMRLGNGLELRLRQGNDGLAPVGTNSGVRPVPSPLRGGEFYR